VGEGIESPYVSVAEARAYLKAGNKFVYRLINLGEIESIKRGKRRLVVRQSLREYVERERVERSA
jgi:excisionase family DNA binding protein